MEFILNGVLSKSVWSFQNFLWMKRNSYIYCCLYGIQNWAVLPFLHYNTEELGLLSSCIVKTLLNSSFRRTINKGHCSSHFSIGTIQSPFNPSVYQFTYFFKLFLIYHLIFFESFGIGAFVYYDFNFFIWGIQVLWYAIGV